MRLHLTLALLTAILLFVTIRESRPNKFTFASVQAKAEELSKKGYQPPTQLAPPVLQNLSVEELADIRWKESATIWKKEGLPFQIKLWHLGHDYKKPVHINTVGLKGVKELPYSKTFFDFGNTHVDKALPDDLGYAGFRIHYPINNNNYLDEIGSFLGASYFRIIGKDQWYGLSARGISLDSMVPDRSKPGYMEPEEFPDFTDFWLMVPKTASELDIYALMQSPSVTGAYSFAIHPGVETTVDIQATLFVRKKVKRFGLGMLTSMYLFGENSREWPKDNLHPEIHDSDGALMQNGKGEWLWRPLQAHLTEDPKTHEWQGPMQEYYFEDNNPKGFGLMQRDREFAHYQDLDANYHKRPCAWVQPIGNWGKGHVNLLQLPSTNVNTDNVGMMWVPEKTPGPGERLDLSYRVTFFSQDSQIPPLATVKQTFVVQPPPDVPKPAEAKPPVALEIKTPPAKPPVRVPTLVGPVPRFQKQWPQIVLDFVGNGIDLPKDNNASNSPIPEPVVQSTPPNKFGHVRIIPNREENSWRVTFDVLAEENDKPLELRAQLVSNGKPLSEVWTYVWYSPEKPGTKKP